MLPFYVLVFWPPGMWDPSSMTRNRTHTPCIGRQSLNHWKVKVKSLSRSQLFTTPWTAAYQAPPSMEFSRQEYWSGLPFPSPGDLPNPGIKPGSPALQADALPSEPPGKPTGLQGKSLCSLFLSQLLSQAGFRWWQDDWPQL